MGILRYIVQGFGWEVGREGARETIAKVNEAGDRAAPAETPRERARREAAEAKAAEERARAERRAAQEHARAEKRAAAERAAKIDAELAELKRKAGR